jgi:hypothetical protein
LYRTVSSFPLTAFGFWLIAMPVSLLYFTLSQLMLQRVSIARSVPELTTGHGAIMGIREVVSLDESL